MGALLRPVSHIRPETVDSRFFGWLCTSAAFTETVRSSAVGVGDGRRCVFNRDKLLTKSSLPPLDEQRRIVARIEELAAQIEEAHAFRQQATEESEALLASVLREVFRVEQPQILLGEALQLHRGFDLPKQLIIPGPYPVIGSNGEIGSHR